MGFSVFTVPFFLWVIVCVPLISFSCLIALVSTSVTMLRSPEHWPVSSLEAREAVLFTVTCINSTWYILKWIDESWLHWRDVNGWYISILHVFCLHSHLVKHQNNKKKIRNITIRANIKKDLLKRAQCFQDCRVSVTSPPFFVGFCKSHFIRQSRSSPVGGSSMADWNLTVTLGCEWCLLTLPHTSL